MQPIAIPSYDMSSFQAAISEDPFLLHKHPCVVHDFVGGCRMFQKWRDPDYIKEHYGDMRVRAGAPQFVTAHDQKLFEVGTTYAKYLEYVDHPERADELFQGEWLSGEAEDFKRQSLPLYCGNVSFVNSPNDPIFADMSPLSPLPDGDWNRHIPYYYQLRNHIWLYVSPRGALTPLHEDALGVITYLAQLRGKKQAILFSPTDRPHYHNRENGFVDPLAADLSQYPSFHQAQPWVGDLNEGDTLLFGPYWAHHVRTIEQSTTVSVDLVNATNLSIYADSDEWPRRLASLTKGTRIEAAAAIAADTPEDKVEAEIALGRRIMQQALGIHIRQTADPQTRAVCRHLLAELAQVTQAGGRSRFAPPPLIVPLNAEAA